MVSTVQDEVNISWYETTSSPAPQHAAPLSYYMYNETLVPAEHALGSCQTRSGPKYE